MLSNLIEKLEAKFNELKPKDSNDKLFNQVEQYEGQFDDISEFTLMPPSAFIELSNGQPSEDARQNTMTTSIAAYVTTNHIKGLKPISMFNIIDELRSQLNKQSIAGGFLKFVGFERLAIFPGFIAYQVNFTHMEI